MSKRTGDVSTNPNIFAPSTTDLDDMIRRAMAKCDASVERAQDERMARALRSSRGRWPSSALPWPRR